MITAAITSSSQPVPAWGVPAMHMEETMMPLMAANAARDGEDHHFCLGDIDAAQTRRLRIAANGVDRSAKGRVF